MPTERQTSARQESMIQPARSTGFRAIQGIVDEHKEKCEVCGGSGQCTMCKGTGNGGQCTNCGGTGPCPQCEGTGPREPGLTKLPAPSIGSSEQTCAPAA